MIPKPSKNSLETKWRSDAFADVGSSRKPERPASRIRYRTISALKPIAWGPCLIAAWSVACGSERPHLTHAVETAEWLRSVAVQIDGAIAWPDDARTEGVRPGIAEGVAGKVLFFLALYEATGDRQYLADGTGGADYLLAMLPQQLGNLNALPIATSMYTGVGFTLNEVFAITGDRRYRDGALRAVQLIHDHATRDDDGAWWSTYNDVLNGTAGTRLFLLYAAREMGHDPSLDLAIAAGEKLLSLAMPHSGGITWKLREDREFILPNFSHGAAGVGFFLVTLYRDTGRAEFLEAALTSARYLEAVAKTDGDTFVVPYGWPV